MWFRFLKAIKNGEHRLAPMTWVAAAGALIYTISPIDLIPELFLGPLGFTDDAGLWAFIIVLVTREKQRWEASLKEGAIDV
ncbi:YkvA family protein [Demequina pelophila]|uniref:YkvA family protein n=1 Tax=Demequina pelophila TaxID=1638984 RepID=UPI000781FF72|nr:YkvA family protein [Demequina pelophila]